MFGLSAWGDQTPSDLERALNDIKYLEERGRDLESTANRNAVAVRYIGPCIVEGYDELNVDYKPLYPAKKKCDF